MRGMSHRRRLRAAGAVGGPAGGGAGDVRGHLGRGRRAAGAWVDGSSGAQPFVNDAMRQGRITFAGERVDGPPPLGCGEARYEMVRAGPEYLFQGGLADPAAQAAALGFGSGEIVHLSLGCVRDGADIGMDFSLIDDDTALFALDNVIYRMVREQPQ